MTEFRTTALNSRAAIRPITLRTMRVETDFRRSTQRLERQERDKYGSFLWNMMRMDPKPKVTLMDVVGAKGDNLVDYGREGDLKVSVDHYHARFDRAALIRVLKFYTVFMLQRARKERDLDRQLFQIFKAVEFARMIVQYSPYSIHAESESIVFCVFNDLADQRPGLFRKYIEPEQAIYNSMKKLHFSPVDTETRMAMAEQMMRQSSYFDAMVQYQYLLTRFPRVPRHADTPRGRVYVSIGEIFQNLIDYVEEGPGQFQDARKLKNFIVRYNRDYAEKGKALVPIRDPSPSQIRRAVISMREVCVLWFQRALAVRLGPRMVMRLVTLLADHYMKAGRSKDAYKVLHAGYSYWRRVPDGMESLGQRIEYLNLMIDVGTRLKLRETVAFASQQLRDYQNRLTDLELAAAAVEKRKEALLAGEELSE